MSHVILSLDPGGTTGVCVGRYDGSTLKLTPGQQKFTLDELYRMLETGMTVNQPDSMHIIYEDFNYRNYARMGLDLTPVKMIGIIELFRERYEPNVTFAKQTAAQGKAFYSDDKLKELGVYKKGCPHGMDATRHLLQWVTFGPGSQYINVHETPMELTHATI